MRTPSTVHRLLRARRSLGVAGLTAYCLLAAVLCLLFTVHRSPAALYWKPTGNNNDVTLRRAQGSHQAMLAAGYRRVPLALVTERAINLKAADGAIAPRDSAERAALDLPPRERTWDGITLRYRPVDTNELAAIAAAELAAEIARHQAKDLRQKKAEVILWTVLRRSQAVIGTNLVDVAAWKFQANEPEVIQLTLMDMEAADPNNAQLRNVASKLSDIRNVFRDMGWDIKDAVDHTALPTVQEISK